MKRSKVLGRWSVLAGALSLIATLPISVSAGASSIPSPHGVRARGTATTILVSWSRPAGSAVKSYVVTSEPSRRTCVTAVTHCDVKGLRLGRSYRFSVVARDSSGSSLPSVLSNRVKVAAAGAYFVNTLNLADTQIQKYDNAFESSPTNAQANLELKKLAGAFGTLSKSLSLEAWPARAKSDVIAFVAAFRSLGADSINDLTAETVSGASEAYFALQTETNKEVLIEAKVRAALSLPPLIIPPFTQTPSPVALGTTQTVHDFSGDAISVTASQVVDPATAASGSGLPDSGYRFVAVDLTINNMSTQDVADDANFTTTVTGSDGQTYSADFGAVSQCTNFEEGIGYFNAAAGAIATGCVIFELPTSVTVQSISFSFAQGYLDTVEWSD